MNVNTLHRLKIHKLCFRFVFQDIAILHFNKGVMLKYSVCYESHHKEDLMYFLKTKSSLLHGYAMLKPV